MVKGQLKELDNGEVISLADCPVTDQDDFRWQVNQYLSLHRAHISALFCEPAAGGKYGLYCVLTSAARGKTALLMTEVADHYPALTPQIPQAHLFEREIFEQWGITPAGHPWLKPVRKTVYETAANGKPAAAFFALQGDEVHEVAVGPVHAGVIEPGHFRFQCLGETVYHLEIALGYQHRGIAAVLCKAPAVRRLRYMETLAGDTTIGHTTAYCRILENLGGIVIPRHGAEIRVVAAELERLANHCGDLGALARDVGFLPVQNYCGALRGDFLNLTGELCGNRFGRGLVVPGGAAYSLTEQITARILKKLESIEKYFEDAVSLMFNSPSLLARLEGTGILTAETAAAIGLVGPAARACGLAEDLRCDLPYGLYKFLGIPLSSASGGDCYARAYVRLLEARASLQYLKQLLPVLAYGSCLTVPAPLAADRLAISLVEGWRGEICHVAATDPRGELAFYRIVDPSFHNWFGLAYALRGQQISDFPLCNKSFNLSYCGHDL